MNINLTLLGQMITFILFVLATWRWVWPPLIQALEERREKISQGLAAAERSHRELDDAKHQAAEALREARTQGAAIIERANQRAHRLIEEAKEDARQEGARLLLAAQSEIEQEAASARESLRKEFAGLAMAGAEHVLGKSIDQSTHQALLDELMEQVSVAQ